jgi:drug/metabolite transporter (DMT)-like permease
MAGVAILGLNGSPANDPEQVVSLGVVAALRVQAESWTFGLGAWLTLASAVIFAGVILLLDRWGRTVPPGHLTVGYLAGMGLPALLLATTQAAVDPGLGVWLNGTATLLREPAVLRDILMLIVTTVLSFHWMSAYQPRVSATRAALIYLLEPVFGATFSLVWGLDQLTLSLVVGGALILGGNLLAELPGWLRERRS